MKRAVQLFLGGPANAREIERLMGEARKEAGGEFCDDQRDALRALLIDASAGRAYLASRNRDPVGYITVVFAHCVCHGGRVGCIDEVYLVPGERSTDLESRLIRGCVADLDAFGVQTVFGLCRDGAEAVRACAQDDQIGVDMRLVKLAES